MQLSKYQAVPSGMSFDLVTAPPAPAYVLSTPGNGVVVSLAGTGTWAVGVFTTRDGVTYTLLATLTSPGRWQYPLTNVTAVAIQVTSYTSGAISGLLAYGGLSPVTNVSSLFGAFLVFSYNNTPSEPPTGNQVRCDSATFAQARKVWIANTPVDGSDQFFALRHVPFGGTLLLQNKTDHTGAVLFTITGPPIDKGAYVEVPVAYLQGIASLNSQQALLAAFNPGASISLSTATAQPADERTPDGRG